MAIDINEIKKVVIDSIKASIGDQLTQTTNTATQETYGMVFNARPNPAMPIPAYPYAVLDLTGISDVDWFTTNLRFDTDTQMWRYETHKQVDMQISIYGEDSLMLAETLSTSYRRDSILNILVVGGLGLVSVERVQILPELLQTDFLESSFVNLSVRVNDVYEDADLESIENVIMQGTLEGEGTATGEDIIIDIDTTTP